MISNSDVTGVDGLLEIQVSHWGRAIVRVREQCCVPGVAILGGIKEDQRLWMHVLHPLQPSFSSRRSLLISQELM